MNRGWLVCVGFLILGCGAHAEPNRPAATPAERVPETKKATSDPCTAQCMLVIADMQGLREEARAKTLSEHTAEGGIQLFREFEALPTRFSSLHTNLADRLTRLSKASTKVLDYVDAVDAGQNVDVNEFTATLDTATSEEVGLLEYCNPFLPTPVELVAGRP